MPQWIVREYISRRGGAKFNPNSLVPSRLPILGFGVENIKINGQFIRNIFLKPELQVEMGEEGYDKGAKILLDFFKSELRQYDFDQFDPLAKKIVECCLNDGSLQDYLDFIPISY